MSLIIKVPGVTFTKPLPKLYRDAVINAGTLACYDALNRVSWQKQLAPLTGSPSTEKWVNLVDGVADGLFTSIAPSSEITFANGFVSSNLSSSEKITLLNSAIPAPPSAILGIQWVKHGVQTATGQIAVANFFGWGLIGYTESVYGAIPANRFYVGGSGSAPREIPNVISSGSVLQLAVYFDSATLTLKGYVNGVEVVSAAGYAALGASATPATLMFQAGISSAYLGTFYRTIIDKMTAGKTPAEIVALDYALNNGRFV